MTDAVNIFPPLFRVTDADGAPVSGATIEFYDANTSDALTVYSDFDLTAELGSIIYTDSGGAPVSEEGSNNKVMIYTGSEPYKVIIKDADGVTLATYDDVIGAVVGGGGGGGGDGITEDEADFRYVRNPSALTEDTTIDDTDLIPRWSTSDSENKSVTWATIKTTLAAAFEADGTVIETGTSCLFVQTSAPTGWTKSTAHDNKALRLVSGTASTGGSLGFTTAFGTARSITGSVGGTSITESQLASHDHEVPIRYYNLVEGGGGSVAALVTPTEALFSGTVNETTDVAGSDNSHTHSLSLNTLNIGVLYVDVINAVRN